MFQYVVFDTVIKSSTFQLSFLRSFYLQGGDHRWVRQRGRRLHCSQRNPYFWTLWNREGGEWIWWHLVWILTSWIPDWGDDRWRQPVGARWGVLPQADDAPRSRQWGGETGKDQYHGDHHPQRWRWVSLINKWKYTFRPISDPGSFQFEKRGHLVKESCGEAVLSVIRWNYIIII